MERWKPFRNGEYSASSWGRMRREAKTHGAVPGHILNYVVRKDGRAQVNLSVGSVRKTYYVHNVIAECFLGPRPEGKVVNHKDGDRLNNAVSNLEYITAEENQLHAIQNRLHIRGEGVHGVKLTEEKVLQIRELYATGNYTMDALAAEFGVTKGTLHPLLRGKTWKHVAMPEGMPKGRNLKARRGKLTMDTVSEIRRLYKTGAFSQRVLAEKFGVQQFAIHEVVTGKSWQDTE